LSFGVGHYAARRLGFTCIVAKSDDVILHGTFWAEVAYGNAGTSKLSPMHVREGLLPSRQLVSTKEKPQAS